MLSDSKYTGLGNVKKTKFQLLVFCDASKYTYAATVYLHQEEGEKCTNSIIFSKTRLSPNEDITILRLELPAALVFWCSIHTRFVEK